MQCHYPNQFTYELISWDVQDIINCQGFLAGSLVHAVSMTILGTSIISKSTVLYHLGTRK